MNRAPPASSAPATKAPATPVAAVPRQPLTQRPSAVANPAASASKGAANPSSAGTRRLVSAGSASGSQPLASFDASLRNLQQRLVGGGGGGSAAATSSSSRPSTTETIPGAGSAAPSRQNAAGGGSSSSSPLSKEGAALLDRIQEFDLFEAVKLRHGQGAFPNAAASASLLRGGGGGGGGRRADQQHEEDDDDDSNGAGAERGKTSAPIMAVDSGAGGGRISKVGLFIHGSRQAGDNGAGDTTQSGGYHHGVTSSIGEDEPLPDDVRLGAIAAAAEALDLARGRRAESEAVKKEAAREAPRAPVGGASSSLSSSSSSAQRKPDVSLAHFSLQLKETAQALDRFMYFNQLVAALEEETRE